jgi:hypothetical protein
VSASLLRELNYTDEEEPSPKRHRSGKPFLPKSPTFEVDSPDYYPSGEEDNGDRSRPQSPVDYERLFEETQVALDKSEAKVAEVVQTLEALRFQHGRLRSRVIYLEGELAVYKRFASIDRTQSTFPGYQQQPTCRVIVAPPPPPPRRV